MLSLLLASLLFNDLLAHDHEVCNYWIDQFTSFPVQLDTCYWTAPDLSYGYYCTQSYNGVDFGEDTVVLLRFQAAECPGGLAGDADLYENVTYSCAEWGDNCHCDGKSSLCDTITTDDCNDTYPITTTYVHDLCVPRSAALGSIRYQCHENTTLSLEQFSDEECEGDITQTPSPTPSPLGLRGELCQTVCPSSAVSMDIKYTFVVVMMMVFLSQWI